MRSMRRLVALLFVIALVAAACGDSGDDTTTTTAGGAGPTTTQGETPTTEPGETPTTTPPAGDLLSIAAESCDYGGVLSSITAVDELTVEFQLCSPDVAFPSKVAFSALAIHPSEYLESTGGGGALVESPVGTGPYMLAEWDRGNQLVLTRNPDYWGDPAPAETLVFRWSDEAAQRLVELQSGTVDGIDNPGADDFEVIAGSGDLQLQERPGTNVFYLGMNRDIAPFDSEEVRQAIGMALDRQRIVDNFYPPGSAVATQFLPPAIFGYTPEPVWYDQDLDGARQLLADAGYPDGFEVELTYRNVDRSYLPTPPTVAQDIQSQLAQIGVTVTILEMESGAFIDAANAGTLPLHLLGWGADYPDATNFLDFHFGAGASPQFGAGFEDIHAVLAQAGGTTDNDERLTLYAEAAELVKQHVPMVPIAHGGSGVAFRADVEGAHASPLGNEYFAAMDPGGRDTFVWMQNAEPIGLYCADETDGESLRACEQINESLLSYEIGGTDVQPSLATEWTATDDLLTWTFTLRDGVTFHDGSAFDANDVVKSFAVQWDAADPLHVGRVGDFTYFQAFFLALLNAPPA